MYSINIDKRLLLNFENSKLVEMHFYFKNGSFKFDRTENFLLFQTAFQMFLQGHLSKEKVTTELKKKYKIKIYENEEIPLWFRNYADLIFTKVSENNTQYLRMEINNHYFIAESSDENNLRTTGYEVYFDSKITPPDFEPYILTLKRFNVQYYYNILQKVSYKW